jgi:hypothetical protein
MLLQTQPGRQLQEMVKQAAHAQSAWTCFASRAATGQQRSSVATSSAISASGSGCSTSRAARSATKSEDCRLCCCSICLLCEALWLAALQSSNSICNSLHKLWCCSQSRKSCNIQT